MTDAVIEILKTWGELNLFGVLVLGTIFFVCAFVPIPRSALCLASGAIFGLHAISIIVPSTTLGAVIAFLSARYLFAEEIRRMVDRRPKLRIFFDAVDHESWRVVGLMRLGGPFPSFFQNFIFGITRIDLWSFAAATFIFTIPQTSLYVYLGAFGKELLQEHTLSLSSGLGCLAALTMCSVACFVGRRVQASLRQLALTLHF